MKKSDSHITLERISQKIKEGMDQSSKRLIEKKKHTGGKLIFQKNGQIETISFEKEKSE